MVNNITIMINSYPIMINSYPIMINSYSLMINSYSLMVVFDDSYFLKYRLSLLGVDTHDIMAANL